MTKRIDPKAKAENAARRRAERLANYPERSINPTELQREFADVAPRIRDRLEYLFHRFRGKTIGAVCWDFEDIVQTGMLYAWEEFIRQHKRGIFNLGSVIKWSAARLGTTVHELVEEQFRFGPNVDEFGNDVADMMSENNRVREYRKALAVESNCGERERDRLARNANTRSRRKRSGDWRTEQPSNGTWRDLLVRDSELLPAETAQAETDFADYLDELNPRQRVVAEGLAAGNSPGWVACQLGVSRGCVADQYVSVLRKVWNRRQ